MHELSIASAILDTAIRHARDRRVSIVRLHVGALRQVVPSSLDFYFGIVRRDTVCEEAQLEIELVSALMRCPECDREWDPAPEPAHDADPALLLPQFRCPACGAAGAEVLAGNELLVDSIDVLGAEQAEPAVASNGRVPGMAGAAREDDQQD